MADNLQLTAVQHGDAMMDQRRHMLEAKKSAPASSKQALQLTHDDVAN